VNLIEIGEVVNTHGVRGEIKLNPWTDSLDSLLDVETFYYDASGKTESLVVQQIRIHKNCAIIKVEGIDSMQMAEKFRGKILFIEKEELPEGLYYIADLIGLTVMTNDGELGKVTDVFSTGSNDVYEVKKQGSKPVYLPAISQVVEEINILEGFIKVTVPEGLLDD